jgi:integrase
VGSVTPYDTKGGRRYRVRYRTPDHRQTDKRGFKTKKEAELFLATVEISKARGEFVQDSAARVAIGNLGPGWLGAQAHLKPSSLAPLEIAWRVHVEPRWGTTPIGRVRTSDVQKWIASLAAGSRDKKPLGATSIIRAHGVLAGILDVAVRDRRLTTNPARGISLPRKPKKRRAYLSHEQVELLAIESRTQGLLIRLLCYTGLRWGEATALRVRDLDLLRQRLMVNENAVRVNGRIIVGTPKSHNSRSVPIPMFLIESLALACAGQTRDALVFDKGGTHLPQPTSKGGWFISAVTRAQAKDDTFPTPTVHDLRHTAASLAISAGANVKAVQRMLGHASAAMTLDTYTDLFDGDLDGVSQALNQARHKALVGKTWAELVQDDVVDLDEARNIREVGPDSVVPSLGFEPRLKRF